MKKQKLNLKKLSVSSFKTEDLKTYAAGAGGTGVRVCSVAVCDTINVTACYGNWQCQKYDTTPCGW